ALSNARPVVSPAVTSAIETANRRVRVRTSTAPTAAGSTIIANRAVWAPVIGQAPGPHRSGLSVRGGAVAAPRQNPWPAPTSSQPISPVAELGQTGPGPGTTRPRRQPTTPR